MIALTDEEIAVIDRDSPYDGYDRRIFGNSADRLIDQAREANALRTQLATATDMLKLMGNQLAMAAPVLAAVASWRQEGHLRGAAQLHEAFEDYGAWLASHPHVTYAGVVSVEGKGNSNG